MLPVIKWPSVTRLVLQIKNNPIAITRILQERWAQNSDFSSIYITRALIPKIKVRKIRT